MSGKYYGRRCIGFVKKNGFLEGKKKRFFVGFVGVAPRARSRGVTAWNTRLCAVGFLGTSAVCIVVLVLNSLIIKGFISFRGSPGHRGFVYLSCWRLSIRLVLWRTSSEWRDDTRKGLENYCGISSASILLVHSLR